MRYRYKRKKVIMVQPTLIHHPKFHHSASYGVNDPRFMRYITQNSKT